jgi:acyl dehydratase
MSFDDQELAALVGHRFPGGTYTVAHWENWLLTHCTGREPLPDGLVHPIVLFHAPIQGARTSIAELFAVCGSDGNPGAVGLVGYDWEYAQALREDVTYDVAGGIVRAERHRSDSGAVADTVAFTIELFDGGSLAARVTNTWRFHRSGVPERPPLAAPSIANGELPPWEMASVEAGRMRTMAAILRDPYPVHWDRRGNERLGLGGRVINQGPLNLGYVANMLMEWAGPASIRRLTVTFGRPVLDEDHVVSGGRVLHTEGGIAHCEVWLERDGEVVVSGTAEVLRETS